MTEPMPEPTDHLPAPHRGLPDTRRAALLTFADYIDRSGWHDAAAVGREHAQRYPDGECQVTMRNEADRVRVEWTGTRGPALVSPEKIEDWAGRTNELVDRNEMLRAELNQVSANPVAYRAADGTVTVDWPEGARSCLVTRVLVDEMVSDRNLLLDLLRQACDGWEAEHRTPYGALRDVAQGEIVRIRTAAGMHRG